MRKSPALKLFLIAVLILKGSLTVKKQYIVSTKALYIENN